MDATFPCSEDIMSDLPKDPMMLVSFINTELRDRFPNLERFAKAHLVDGEELKKKAALVGFEYDEKLNRFV